MISLPTFVRRVVLGLTVGCMLVAFAAQPGVTLEAGEIWATEIVGRVTLASAGASEDTVRMGTTLMQGATLKTERGARAVFAFSDGTIVKEMEDSEWRVDEFLVDPAAPLPPAELRPTRPGEVVRPPEEKTLSRTKLRFEQGEIEVQVAPLDLARGARFQVETPAGIVSIRGTTFRLRLGPAGNEANELSVTVIEGMVVFFTKDGKVVEYVSPNRPYVVKIPR